MSADRPSWPPMRSAAALQPAHRFARTPKSPLGSTIVSEEGSPVAARAVPPAARGTGPAQVDAPVGHRAQAVQVVPGRPRLVPRPARRLGGVPARIKHYLPPDAIEQKIRALADRSTTEPRDVFDLDHLFRQYPDALAQSRPDPKKTLAAKERAIDIPYDDYKTLVVEFLEEDIVVLYGTEPAWSDMVLRVVERLEEKLRSER